jgi:hypothetical protein
MDDNAAADAEGFATLDRGYYLRKVALLDRIALLDGPEPQHPQRDTDVTAEAAALFLLDTDQASLAPGIRTQAEIHPRRYVRCAYAHWAKNL